MTKENDTYISKLLKEHKLVAHQSSKIEAYVAEVFEANTTLDLTADTDQEVFWHKHILNSLYGINLIAQYGKVDIGLKIADIGSGAGIPAIPLAISLPQHQFTLIEPMQKRAHFLERVVEKLHITNVEIINERAEILGRQDTHRAQYDLVTARAVSALASIAELALPLCKTHGACILYKHLEENELTHAEHALHVLGSAPATIINTEKENTFRDFVVLRKKSDTPDGYPRRNGLPQKRPIN